MDQLGKVRRRAHFPRTNGILGCSGCVNIVAARVCRRLPLDVLFCVALGLDLDDITHLNRRLASTTYGMEEANCSTFVHENLSKTLIRRS
jgi:hypothetical protein